MSEIPVQEPVVAVPVKNQFQISDWLTIVTILLSISAAIIYFAGWVYEEYWYGFFGINMTQINIPLQQIMIEGLPGIIIVAVSSFFAASIFYIFPIGKKDNKTNSNFMWIIVTAYGISVLIVVLIGIVYREFLNPLPKEIGDSGFGLALVFSTLLLLQFSKRYRISALLNATKEISPLLINMALSSLLVTPLGETAYDLFSKLGNESLKSFLNSIEKDYGNRKEKIVIDILNAWRFWIGLVILFFLLLSLTISAIWGRADAHYGVRLMMGGWDMNETYIYSSKSDLPFPLSSGSYAAIGYKYGPFGLVANDDQVYYLVDWKIGDYYGARPNLYAVPRTNDNSLIILYAPKPTPKNLPIPPVKIGPSFSVTSSPESPSPTP